MIWLFAAPLVSRAVKVVATFVAGLVILMMMGAPLLGLFVQPWSRWWFGQSNGVYSVGAPAVTGSGAVPLPVITGSGGASQPAVSDAQRYLLAIGAGFSATEAIIATAISIAEDGSGNPAAMSGRNNNGTFDLGLWQINSVHWGDYGGQTALTNPVVNAVAAHTIYTRAGWCSWSTYERSCGNGYTGAYAANMGRARAAAGGH